MVAILVSAQGCAGRGRTGDMAIAMMVKSIVQKRGAEGHTLVTTLV